ncbi:hypothetical protein [Facilibium subflavum]|uniref:hypothetical protein n=1 Tax=Facilibium subflavum TaxID=2219058 RepID=UPI000E649B8A|nr:hypothetical protein [Facilibium subflavum]
MQTHQIKLKPSKIKIAMLVSFYLFVLGVCLLLLNDRLLYLALLLWLLALFAQFYYWIKQDQLQIIMLLLMAYRSQMNLYITGRWFDNVFVDKKYFFAHFFYMELCVIAQGKKIKKSFWLFKDNFYTEADRRRLIQYLMSENG